MSVGAGWLVAAFGSSETWVGVGVHSFAECYMVAYYDLTDPGVVRCAGQINH